MSKLTRKEQEEWKKFSQAEDEHYEARKRFEERRQEIIREQKLEEMLLEFLKSRGLLPEQRHRPPWYAESKQHPKHGAAINIIIATDKDEIEEELEEETS